MKTTHQPKSVPVRIARGLVLAFIVLFSFLLVDHLPSLWNDISPPPNLATIDEFREWKAGGIRAEGTFEIEGRTYMVIVGESGAFLASGPAAYVFDSGGLFVDWTRDMGDVYTEKHGFDLTSGNMKLRKTKMPYQSGAPNP